MARSAANGAGLAGRFLELSLLGLISSGCLALAGSGYLDLPTAVVTAAALLLRILLVAGVVRFAIPPRAVTGLTLVYILFYPVDWAFLSRDFLRATVHLVSFLAVVKILTAKTGRDFVYVKVIALMQLVAAAILSVNLNFFAFLVLFLLFGVATFTSSEIRRAAARPVKIARGGLRRFSFRLALMSVSIALGILALTAGLFFLLPRTAHAAFQRLVSHRLHLPGFSDEVRLGEIGAVLRESAPVMHVRFEGNRRLPPLLWRGAALHRFDGKRWFNPPGESRPLLVENGRVILADDDQRRRRGPRVTYEVHLKDIASDALFFAGVPEVLWIDAAVVLRSGPGTYRLGYGGGAGAMYYASSFLGGPAPAIVAPCEPGECLELPPLDPRIGRLARELTTGLATGEDRARAIERHLRANYRYTTELPARAAADPLAHFLFERKRGHCEYYASAMAVMLRSAGIPSRVVTGFHGGELNPVSGWHVVRAWDAHSWVEAYLPERGWTTFDPTPADPNPRRPTLWSRIGHYVDAAEMFWHDWVVEFDRERQLLLAVHMEQEGLTFGVRWLDRLGMALGGLRESGRRWLDAYGPGAAALLLLALAAWFLAPKAWRWTATRQRVRRARKGEARASDATLLYARMLGALKKRGFEKPPWLTPAEFTRILPLSETSALVIRATDAYHDLRYGGRRDAAPRMVRLLDELEREKRL